MPKSSEKNKNVVPSKINKEQKREGILRASSPLATCLRVDLAVGVISQAIFITVYDIGA